MDHSFPRRVLSRLAIEATRAKLELRRHLSDGDLFVDYGWIKLLYSGDHDNQEIFYHLNQRRWFETEMNVFRSLLAPGQTAIDVGANLGFVTTVLATLVGPTGRVLSFEPSPVVFAKLEKTIEANGLQQVRALNFGCGATSSTARLHEVSENTGNASIVAVGQKSTEIKVEPLDAVDEAWTAPISLLKIDTEGYEPEVLLGAQRLIETNRPIIYLEMGGDYAESTMRSIELLSEAGYTTDHVRSIDWSKVGNGTDFFFYPRR